MDNLTVSSVTVDAIPASGGCSPAGRITRSLLGWGVVAGPFYVGVSLLEAALRPGFDLARHSWSLMENGPFGWVHSAVLVLSGLMVIAAAIGMRRALPVEAAPALLALFGAGQIGAGLFIADPADGFPIGTPEGPGDFTWHGLLHLAAGGVGFFAFTIATVSLGVRFLRHHDRGWGAFSIATGILFLAAFAGIASGGTGPTVIAFTAAVLLAWTWLALICIRLYRRVS
jgi:hypothetical membrane protein